jgi:hypothetical protein
MLTKQKGSVFFRTGKRGLAGIMKSSLKTLCGHIPVKFYRILFLALPPVIALTLILAPPVPISVLGRIPRCPFYSAFGLYCPSCGGTRSFFALLGGSFAQALRYNAFFVFLGIVIFGFYIENAAALAGITIHIVPRKNSFLFISLAFFLIYFVVRNFFPYLTPRI